MSLAWRILLVVLLLNLLVVGAVQTAAHFAQDRWLASTYEARLRAELHLLTFLQAAYAPDLLGDERMTYRLVDAELIREQFDDVVVTSGRPPFEGLLYLNPRGAVHRDPDTFPRGQILQGFEQCWQKPGLVRAAGGFCMAIRQQGEAMGAIWFVPREPPPPSGLPLLPLVVTVLASTLLFGVLVYWILRAIVRTPLLQVEAAAALVGTGRYDARLPELRSVRELDLLARTFNAMAAKVQGHTGELAQAVQAAVEQARQKERALVVSSRLAAMGTLAAGIAHEINNPIGGMSNAVNRLLSAADLQPKQRQYLELVRDGLQRVARTARKVLDFSPRNVQAKPFTLASAVDGARALVEHRLQRQQVAVRAQFPADLPLVFGDPHEIQQVVLNLLLNSLDALEPRGSGGTLSLRGSSQDGRVHLWVEDDGPGMDSKDLGRVMDPFFSNKDQPDASGLGLFICYSIVHNHGGEIELDSAPGKGFRVHITLPAVPPG